MTDSSITRPADKAASTSERMASLHALAFTALRLSTAQLDAFGARLDQALFLQAAKPADANETDIYRHAWQLLNKHRPTFQRLTSDALQQALLQAVQAVGEQGSMRLESGAMDLSLTSFAAMERQVLIDNLSQALDATDRDALVVLSMRIAHLLQSDDIGIAQNPFRSEVFLKAVADAWQKFDTNSESHRLVLQQMQPETFLLLGPVWLELNRDLAARGILPEAEEIWRRKKADAAKQTARPLQERLRGWLVADGKVSLARGGELLGRTFDQIAVEETIPADIRQLLARLKEPLSQLVQNDVTFLFSRLHPARRLVNAVIDCGLGFESGEDGADPVYQALEQAVEQARQENGVQTRQFDAIADEIEAFAAQQVHMSEDTLQESIAEANAQERAAYAQQLAEEDVASRISGGEVEGFIEAFLQTQWTRVLAVVHESRPADLPTARQAMDDLIWSVKPKAAPDERKELIGRLPALLAELNGWLDAVEWDGAERGAFFSELAGRHAANMRGPLDLSPRDQLENRMNVMQKASEHELSRRAREQQDAALAGFMRQISVLLPGRWVEFVRNDGSKVNCRLIWISPGRGRFLFTGRRGRLIFTLEDKALAQALRMVRATIIAPDALVTRALTTALDQLGAK